ncbi:MAG TPA: ATP-binding protein [Bacteroidia bacterium]|nr:ATP-binding protein [Bacteroidia bacterium]
MKDNELNSLLEQLLKQPKECEWIEFKENYHSNEEIGETISALSNGACLHNKSVGYLVFGIKDKVHEVIGTAFRPTAHKIGNEEFENWLIRMLKPRIDFKIHEFIFDGKLISLFEIPATSNQPVSFVNKALIRVGSCNQKLSDFPEKERKIWTKKAAVPFEKEIALANQNSDEIEELLDTESYYKSIKQPYPTNVDTVLDKFIAEKLIIRNARGNYDITNLGALLFAKKLDYFDTISRKAVRVIIYDGKSRIKTLKDQLGVRGYAVKFDGLIKFINDQLPSNEEIKKALRETVRMYPEIAIRELVANSIIHQDFNEKGTGPMVEIFTDRIEISNPGLPLITTDRFIDEYQSRNEHLASLMRRLRICEERGSGIDKVITSIEEYQLPAPQFTIQERHTKIILYSYQTLNEMDKNDKIRACYQHCCLKYVSNEKMTNQSLRERFKIEEKNAAIASRIIKDTSETKLIKDEDPENRSRKYSGYIPFWA